MDRRSIEQEHAGNRQAERLSRRSQKGKDELNLAEFPLCCIADRVKPGQKTLRFEDRTWDEGRGEMITRQLTITGSDEYGLPTALDDAVLLGLIQLTKLANFADRRVCFTRYQLLRLLDWTDESKSYGRIEKSLNRWVGVTLYYQNAWWDRADACWVDEKFHVLDNVTLYDRDKAKTRQRGNRQPATVTSSFVWNDVIYRSFKAGNLKRHRLRFLQAAAERRRDAALPVSRQTLFPLHPVGVQFAGTGVGAHWSRPKLRCSQLEAEAAACHRGTGTARFPEADAGQPAISESLLRRLACCL